MAHRYYSIATAAVGIPMIENVTENFFESRELASIAAAELIVGSLQARLNQSDAASIMVTGGSSPARCYAELAATDLDWSRVHILLSDERWVAACDEDSNEKLLRDTLLVGAANAAQLMPVYSDATSAEARCAELDDVLPTLPMPMVCTLLGMGTDGHIASLFPDAANLDAGLDVDNPQWCIPVSTTASEHLRVSMTLAALLKSAQVVLLFFGEAKRDVYEQAKSSVADVPVAKLLSQMHVPVQVFWAP
ncbi:MAG: 6-phosphogluconolactonase [Woeseiaceae bacterium]